MQDFFLRYEHLAGMTGTAIELGPRVAQDLPAATCCRFPPTGRPSASGCPTRVFGTADAKWEAIVEEVRELHAAGPAGADRHPLDRQVGASFRAADATRASSTRCSTPTTSPPRPRSSPAPGQPGKVTVSTNMAGRGTDIKLGDGVAELGGLHVICTEMHDAARIDRQLIGRCGRQGDPGTFRQYLALDDDLLLAAWGRRRPKTTRSWARSRPGRSTISSRLFRKAQRKIERRHFRDRKVLMYHEKERKKMQGQMGQDPYLDTPG